MIEFLSEEQAFICFEVGSEEKILIDKIPLTFQSVVSYNEPEKEIFNIDDNI